MLLLLICLFSICCHQAGHATVNQTPLSELMHKSIHEIDSLLKDFQQEIQKEKSVLRAVDLEIQDVGILDYSMTPVWWTGSPGSNLTGNHTPATTKYYTLFPFPPGHFKTTTKDPWESWNFPGLESSTDPTDFSGPDPGHFPEFGYRLNQTPTFTKRIVTMLPAYVPTSRNHSFTRPTFPFQVPLSTKPTPLEPYMKHVHFNASYSPGSPTFTLPTKQLMLAPPARWRATMRAKERTLSQYFAMSETKVMRDRTGYWHRGPRQTKANRITAATRRPQQRKRTLSKARVWVQNRQWMKSKNPGRNLRGHIREGENEALPEQQPIQAVDPSLNEKAPALGVEGDPSLNEKAPAPGVEGDPSLNEKAPAPGVEGDPSLNEKAPAPGVEGDPSLNEKAPALGVEEDPSLNVKAPAPGVEGDPSLNEKAPALGVEGDPSLNEKAPAPGLPKAPGIYQGSGVSFSMPGLEDILPTMSIPPMDEMTLYNVSTISATRPTTPNPLLEMETVFMDTAFTEELLKEDDAGFLYVMSPSTIQETTEMTTNTLGLVLYHAENFTASTPLADPHKSYHDLMETQDEGYLTVFLLELARLTAQKSPVHVQEVLSHTEIIFNNMLEQGQLVSFSEEILELATKVSRMFSGGEIGALQSHANMMHQLLLGRAKYLSVEVNSIIDYADLLFEDDEGEDLFEALRMYEHYPNGVLSGHDVCSMLIKSFIKPYHRLRNSDRFRKLADSVLKVVATRFGSLRTGCDMVNRRNGNMAPPGPTQTAATGTTQKPSLRQKIETKRHQIKNRRLQRQKNLDKLLRQGLDDELPVPRNMLPITKHQNRFRVMTPKQLRSNGYMNLVRPTMGYFRRKVGRPAHPQRGVLEMFPRVRQVEVRRRVQANGEETTFKQSPPQQTPGPMRAEVRRIVEESSYSDEEASLKKNLRHALRVNWHRTVTPSMRTREVVAK